jgi:hypothetical protein
LISLKESKEMTTATNGSKVNVFLSPALAIALIMSAGAVAAADGDQEGTRNRPLLVAMEDEGKMGGAGGQIGGGMGAPSPAAQASPGATAPAPMHPHSPEMEKMMREHMGGAASPAPSATPSPGAHRGGSMRHGKGKMSSGMSGGSGGSHGDTGGGMEGGMGGTMSGGHPGPSAVPSPASAATPHSGGMMKDM